MSEIVETPIPDPTFTEYDGEEPVRTVHLNDDRTVTITEPDGSQELVTGAKAEGWFELREALQTPTDQYLRLGRPQRKRPAGA